MTYLGVKHQARATAQAEHGKAVWTERLEVYAAFIEAVEEANQVLIIGRTQLGSLRRRLSTREADANSQQAANDAEEALSSLREAQTAVRAAFKAASRIRVLGPQQLVDVTADVVQVLSARLKALSRGLEATTRREEGANRWLDEEITHQTRFVAAFGGFTARAAHVAEGHELPTVGAGDATHE
jgi:hypothetical protein